MKTKQQRRTGVLPRRPGTGTLTAVAGAVLVLAAASAQAQQTVTVTGIRSAIESAISVKKNSDNIVEAISAEDIGKLPDSSIAESIARLPGIAAQRVGGRATEINIRGLSGDFANTLLNGREQVSTGNNRSVEFDQYPSELLQSVLIYKTPDAALVGQGLSGTIDLQTISPLSFGKRTVSVNFRKERNGQGTPFEGSGDRFNISYVDQFANKTVGIALGFARLSQDVQKSRSEVYCSFSDTNCGDRNFTYQGQSILINHGFKYFVDDTRETRDGAMAVLELKPNKDLSSKLDIFYSKFDKEVVRRGLEIQTNDSWKAGWTGGILDYQAPALSNAVIQNGRLVSGVWSNVNPLSRHIWEPRKDELSSVGWNTKWKFAPKWTGNLDVSYSSAKSNERTAEMEAGLYDTANGRPLPENVTVSNGTQIASLQYDRTNLTNMRLTDPESWGQNGYDKVITTDDKIKSLRLSAQRDLEGLFAKVDFGVNYTQRDKEKGAVENFLRLTSRPASSSGCTFGSWNLCPNTGGALPAGATSIALPGTGLSTVSFNPADALSSYRFDPNVIGDVLRKGWTVNEKITTLFAKADVDTKLAGIPVRGNVGVQIVGTDQSSTAPSIGTTNGQQGLNPSQIAVRTSGKTYTDFLPAANLIFDLKGDQIVRLGVGKQMARPRMDQLSAWTRSEVTNDLKWTGSGGNPKLDPFRATALDISYEKYFGNKGYVSVAGFHKDLKSYIFDLTNTAFDFTGYPNISGRNAISNIGEFTQPVNGKGGKVTGIELAASLPLNMLSKSLDGFGIIASVSDTQSKIRPFGDSDTRPLPGLSKTVATVTAYYEKSGLSARVAARHRTKFIAEIEGFGADREYRYAAAETVTDLQLGYEFQSGLAKGLSILLQVNNLTNEPYREVDANGTQLKLDTYGRTTLLGVSYKF